MLSPGEYYKLVPKGGLENLQYRLWLLQDARQDRQKQIGYMEMCRLDILFWINSFVWQFNPQVLGDEVAPFIAWDFQDEAILYILSCIEDREDLRIQKSRDMGASWMCLLVMIWMSLFHDYKKFLLMSRDVDSVDKAGEPDSLMWKMCFVHEHLPDWMTGGLGDGIIKRKMAFEYRRTKGTVTGDASTGAGGVGGRATSGFMDEFTKMEKAEEVFENTRDTTFCRIFNFTHYGTESMGYTLCYDAKYSSMRSLTLHWSHHPMKNKGLYRYDPDTNKIDYIDKDYQHPPGYDFDRTGAPHGGAFPGIRSPWYDKECKSRTERGVQLHLDIDPRGATSQFFNAFAIKLLIKKHCREPRWVGDLKWDKEKGEPIELVRNELGAIKLWIPVTGDNKVPIMKLGGGADVAAGTGASPSTLSFFAVETCDKILEYSNNKIYPETFASLSVALCRLFGGDVRLAWENQGGSGSTYGQTLLALGYRNLAQASSPDPSLYRNRISEVKLGWFANKKTKVTLFELYRHALQEEEVVNYSEAAMLETANYIYNGDGVDYKKRGKSVSDASGEGAFHGDLVIGDALATKMVKELGGQMPTRREQGQTETVFSVAGRRLWAKRMHHQD